MSQVRTAASPAPALGLFGVAAVVLTILKLVGVVHLSWWLIALVFFGGSLILLVLLIVALLLVAVVAVVKGVVGLIERVADETR